MIMPAGSDLFALSGIAVVCCGVWVRVCTRSGSPQPWHRWSVGILMVLLWCPMGAAQLPVVAYVRGISSDLSITLVVLAALDAWRRLGGASALQARELSIMSAAVALTALGLYPLALGWGDWDMYRSGWGGPGLLLALALVCAACWVKGLRLLPVLVALALLAWALGCLESTNLWDYLMDPWLSVACLVRCAASGVRRLIEWTKSRQTVAA